MKLMKIGILGAAMRSPKTVGGNLGCFALGYSFFEIMDTIAKQNNQRIQIVSIKTLDFVGMIKQIVKKLIGRNDVVSEYYSTLYENLEFTRGDVFLARGKKYLLHSVKQCNCVFDFTAGDSFTDLYGQDRFFQRTGLKKKIIDSGIPLILGSQTIGPFKDPEVQKYAVDVIERCKAVFVRDGQSKQYVEQISQAKPILTTDVAFFLPYNKNDNKDGKKKAGFNPSGLLWMGGYTGSNQFGLTVDYQKYCKTIIEYLFRMGYEVYLILHAYKPVVQEGYYYADNDKLAVDALHEVYPETIVSPYFTTPMEAKSYISGMDLFIGARMHATIAAISAGIPVIPFSYSRKFEGLFSSLNYPYVVEGTKWETKKAIEKTENWIESIEELKECVSTCSDIIKSKNNYLLSNYTAIVNNSIQSKKNDNR